MELGITGERTVPGVAHENYWFRRHEVAYRFAAGRCAGADVLDAGCGEGYGTAILAGAARRAVGVDLAADVCAHARATYPHLGFVQAELGALPFDDRAMAVVVSLQVIEHLWDIPRYLDEVVRVLRPGGLFVCGTPNRLTFTPNGAGPVNPFHTVEFSAAELRRVLATRFEAVELFGVCHGPRLQAVEVVRGASIARLVLDAPLQDWPAALAELVTSVTVADFEVRDEREAEPDASLDLLAIARVRREPAA